MFMPFAAHPSTLLFATEASPLATLATAAPGSEVSNGHSNGHNTHSRRSDAVGSSSGNSFDPAVRGPAWVRYTK